MTEHHDSIGLIVAKLTVAWGAVGISRLEALQDLQIVAALFAIIFTGFQIFVLVRDKIWRDGREK